MLILGRLPPREWPHLYVTALRSLYYGLLNMFPATSLVLGPVRTHTVRIDFFHHTSPSSEPYHRNPFAWTQLANVVWVEQPVGVSEALRAMCIMDANQRSPDRILSGNAEHYQRRRACRSSRGFPRPVPRCV